MHTWFLFAVSQAADLPLSTDGCDAIDGLAELRFTFNVANGGEVKVVRQWTYRPATREVTRRVDDAELTFHFGAPEGDAQTQADAQFVNDSFWLIPQCHMNWATDVAFTERGQHPIPVGQGTARMVTARYDAEGGGYTPGDAYDLYLDDAGLLVAWTYRRKAGPEPTLSTTFSDRVDAAGLQIATDHVGPDGEFRLFFTDVAATP